MSSRSVITTENLADPVTLTGVDPSKDGPFSTEGERTRVIVFSLQSSSSDPGPKPGRLACCYQCCCMTNSRAFMKFLTCRDSVFRIGPSSHITITRTVPGAPHRSRHIMGTVPEQSGVRHGWALGMGELATGPFLIDEGWVLDTSSF